MGVIKEENTAETCSSNIRVWHIGKIQTQAYKNV